MVSLVHVKFMQGSAIKEIALTNQATKEQLVDLLSKVRKFVDGVPERSRQGVREVWPKLEGDLLLAEKQLEVASPAILVAGKLEITHE